MKFSRRSLITSGIAATSLAMIPALHPRRGVAQTNQKNVTVYTYRKFPLDEEIFTGFTRQTGVAVKLVKFGENELVDRIVQEGASCTGDVMIISDVHRLWSAQKQGVLTPIVSSTLTAQIPANCRDPQGHWFGLSKRTRAIMYHKDRVNPADLSTYEALASSQWSKRLLMGSGSHVYSQSMMAAVIEHLGAKDAEEWAKGMVANFARSPAGEDKEQLLAIAAGLGDITIANVHPLVRLIKSDNPDDQAVARKIGVFFPNQQSWGSHVNIGGGAVLKHAKNQPMAIKLLEYLSNPKAQVFWVQTSSEYPLIASHPVDPIVGSYGLFQQDDTSVAQYIQQADLAGQIFQRVGWI